MNDDPRPEPFSREWDAAGGSEPLALYGSAPPPGAEVLGNTVVPGDGLPSSGRMSRKRWIAVGTAGLLVAGVAGGGAVIAGRLSGGGAQPAEVIPATALAYVGVDLDPPAGQKVNALRFLRKFPDLTQEISEDDDPRRLLFDLLSDGGAVPDSVDWETDVDPWLGERGAVAVLPGIDGGDPIPVVVLQVTDEDEARSALPRLTEELGQGTSAGLAITEGYAVMAEDQAAADAVVRETGNGSLADDGQFTADVESMGDRGVVVGWVDVAASGRLYTEMMGAEGVDADQQAIVDNLVGRYVMGVRFDGDDMEMVATGRDLGPDAAALDGPGTVELGRLPESTAVAVGMADAGATLAESWPELMESWAGLGPLALFFGGLDAGATPDDLDSTLEDATGLNLPEDIEALLGTSLSLALDRAGLPDAPRVGARIVSDPAAAQDALDRVIGALESQGLELPELARRDTDDGVVISSSEEQADALAANGTLGEDKGFRAAMDGGAEADVAFYADIDGLGKALAASGTEDDETLLATMDQIDAVGMTASADGDEASFTLRVITR